MQSLAGLSDQLSELPEPEQFLSRLAVGLPGPPAAAKQRAACLQFKLQLPDLLADLRPGLAAAIDCLRTVRTSQRLRQVLLGTLSLGNILNSGSRSLGRCFAFHVSCLPQLADLRDSNGLSLLCALADQLWRKWPDSLALPDEFRKLDLAARVTEEAVDEAVKEVRERCRLLGEALRKFKPAGPRDAFKSCMEPFHKYASSVLDSLEASRRQLREEFQATADYLALDASKYRPELLLADLRSFIDAFEAAATAEEQRRSRAAAAEAAAAAAAASSGTAGASSTASWRRQQPQKPQQQQRGKENGGCGGEDSDSLGLVDNLLEVLKSGRAFNTPHSGRRTPRQGAERRAHLLSGSQLQAEAAVSPSQQQQQQQQQRQQQRQRQSEAAAATTAAVLASLRDDFQ
ncbi:hypothetical protein BOX15_Mlig009906g1 [Macrostomum lignano]|uniref:FH2 domain-containing protein n=1 Tax=Macrostomum lignano TaxID=282301 RepID=A0A267F9R2_9PLAT|nr:hypothetical protein BOX15_Mlig009906g1 [Macrostomum lignano]